MSLNLRFAVSFADLYMYGCMLHYKDVFIEVF